jgi:muramoyltetrapeptide carboxypeptidase
MTASEPNAVMGATDARGGGTSPLPRRALLGGLVGVPLVLGLPAAAPAQTARPRSMPMLRPPRLQTGDIMGLVAPSGASFDPDEEAYGDENVRALGFVPRRGRHTMDQFGYLAGRDEDRAADINAMFADPMVKAILCTRGGWGAARLLRHLDYGLIRANPKPVIGLSDVTGLHLALQARAGLVSFHGPTAAGAWGPIAVASLKEVLMQAGTPTWSAPRSEEARLVPRRWRTVAITPGVAQGRLIGGNLTVLSALVGTPFMPDLKGAILMLEDINEAEYRIDRMITHLSLAGLLDGIAGFVFGQCTDCTDSGGGYGGFTLSTILQQHIKPLGVPAFYGAAFGHIADQPLLPLGCDVELDANARTLRLLAPAVV